MKFSKRRLKHLAIYVATACVSAQIGALVGSAVRVWWENVDQDTRPQVLK